MRLRHYYRRASESMLASSVLLCLAFLQTTQADLPFTYTNPQQCTPFNITWTTSPGAYPYSLYLVSVDSTIQSFLITKEAGPPRAKEVTFQYVLPQATSLFQDFVISLADSIGNGNTSDVLHVISDKNAPTNCAPYSQGQAFVYSSEPLNWLSSDTTPSCADLHYSIIPQNGSYGGTPPFSFTLLPIGQTPITVNIPSSASRDLASLDYVAPLPFKEGTRYMQFMSDASGGGSGGSSPVYTTVAGNDTSCLAPGYTLPNMNRTNALPLGRLYDGFAVLDGGTFSQDVNANPSTTQGTSQMQPQPNSPSQSHSSSSSSKETQSPPSSSSHSQTGLIGGIVGGVVGVSAILILIAIYLLCRKRREKQHNLAKDEIPINIDPDEDQSNTLVEKGKAKRVDERHSYTVSPLPSEASGSHISPLLSEVMQFRDVIEGHVARSSMSKEMRLANVGGANVAPLSSESNPIGGPNPMYSGGALHPDLSSTQRPGTGGENVHNGTLRDAQGTRRSSSGSPDESAFWHSSGAADGSTGVVRNEPRAQNDPSSALSPSREGITEDHANQEAHIPSSASLQQGTIIQHQDAGPAQSSLDELPPTYGQWIRPQASTSKEEDGQNGKQASEASANDQGSGAR